MTTEQITEARHIIQTIRQQIGPSSLMCVGAREYTFDGETDRYRAMLRFRITISRAVRHWIQIELAWDDTYTVKLIKAKRLTRAPMDRIIAGETANETETHTDVYCDQLAEIVYQLGLADHSRTWPKGVSS